jgi:hypothetical protein
MKKDRTQRTKTARSRVLCARRTRAGEQQQIAVLCAGAHALQQGGFVVRNDSAKMRLSSRALAGGC